MIVATLQFLKNYKKLLLCIFVLPFLSGGWLTPTCNIVFAYVLPIHYYAAGKPLPAKARNCLYKIYKDKKFIDSIRYIVNKDFFYTRQNGYTKGMSLGTLIVFDFDPFEDRRTFHYYGRSIIIHEVLHSHQIRRDTKPIFLIRLAWQTIKYGSYEKTPIEQEAITAEVNEVKCYENPVCE